MKIRVAEALSKNKNFDWSVVPNTRGVYFVFYKGLSKPKFLKKGTGGWFKKKNPNVSIKDLNEKWVNFQNNEDTILYIGKAGKNNTLRKRIKSYIKFGQGKSSSHWGGRYIWQIDNVNNLEICWQEVNNPEAEEKNLFINFKKKHNQQLPFANLRM